MEYIYFLQREQDTDYKSYKYGKTTDIKNRLNAPDYRRATIYLVRGVPNSTSAENKIEKIFSKKYLKTNSIHKDFGDEDYIIEDNLQIAINIINLICDEENLISPIKNNKSETTTNSEDVINLNEIKVDKKDKLKGIFDSSEEEITNSDNETDKKIEINNDEFKTIFDIIDDGVYEIKDVEKFNKYYKDIKFESYNDGCITSKEINDITKIKLVNVDYKNILDVDRIQGKFITILIKSGKKDLIIGLCENPIYDELDVHYYKSHAGLTKTIKEKININNLKSPIILKNPLKIVSYTYFGKTYYKTI